MKKELNSLNNSGTSNRRGLLFSLSGLAVIAALIAVVPFQTAQQAVTADITSNQKFGLDNYDIRTDKNAAEKIAEFRQSAGRNSATINEFRQKMRDGETALRQRVSTLTVEYSEDLRVPEIIAPDVKQGKAFLTGVSNGKKNAEVLRSFVAENNDLIGLNSAQTAELKVGSDYTNPDGVLSFAHLEQSIDGVPVFNGEIKAGFTRNGEMIRVINNLAPSLDNVAGEFGSADAAVKNAFNFVSRSIRADDTQLNAAASTALKVTFGAGDWGTTAEKMYFPIDAGVARAAWRVLVWESVSAFYVIVDAETGALLWRKNITSDQTAAATYNVYANTTSMMKTLDNPAPLTPGPISPALGTQGVLTSRTNVTLIGNEAPNTFNNLGWISDNQNSTDGNNVESGVDRVAPDGVDSVVVGTNRVFNFNYTPGHSGGGDDPLGADYQKGIATHLFYVSNRYHDELYKLGFTEFARNFQNDNYGRGGSASDRVSAEAQDFSGTNNANFSTPADGGRGKMQMYLWSGPTPDRDGDLDAEIIIHELTHGTSNRLHGNGSGLSSTMSGGMGEGWSDFYAHALLSEASDPINGIYTTGGYSTLGLRATAPTGNYYYGIRAFPKAVRAFTGGANNRPHNPLTFADADSTQLNVSDGAFPAAFAPSAGSVHFLGEIWSSALWEVRAKYIQRLGHDVGNRQVLQYVTDGMKLAPLNPTFLQERDAIISAVVASGTGADVADTWAGFAIRGMGFSSRITTVSPLRVIEAFDSPNLTQLPSFGFTDPAGNNNGFADPGEVIAINIPLTNTTGNPITGVNLQIVGGDAASYGTIAHNTTVSRTANFTIPAGTACGTLLTLTFNVTSNLEPTSFTRQIRVGQPAIGATQNFDGVTAPALPTGWTTTQTGAGTLWVTSSTGANSAPNAAFTTNPTTPGGADLVSSVIPISSASAVLNFRHNYSTEAGFDGGALEISINGGAFSDVITAGGSFISGGYNGTIGASATGNPLINRAAWTGSSTGYISTSIQLPASANGTNVQFKWRLGTDNGTGGNGWNIDNIETFNGFNCSSVVPSAPTNTRADFDADGKTDYSVFRNGGWFVQRSTAGFAGVSWGQNGDFILPGDYDGDNKADFAIFRASANPGVTDYYVINSATGTATGASWGDVGDVPQLGDFNGDNRADFAVYRPSNNTWFILPSNGDAPTSVVLGAAGQTPIVLDYDGDAKSDVAMWNASNGVWTIRKSSDGAILSIVWGQTGDKLVAADYDNDNRDDLGIFRNGQWFVLPSNGGAPIIYNFGQSGDVAAPGDYDGDGDDDAAVYRNGTWFVRTPSNGFTSYQFGVSGDKPVPAAFFPQ